MPNFQLPNTPGRIWELAFLGVGSCTPVLSKFSSMKRVVLSTAVLVWVIASASVSRTDAEGQASPAQARPAPAPVKQGGPAPTVAPSDSHQAMLVDLLLLLPQHQSESRRAGAAGARHPSGRRRRRNMGEGRAEAARTPDAAAGKPATGAEGHRCLRRVDGERAGSAIPRAPKAGYVGIQRLSRTEYAAAVKALVGVDDRRQGRPPAGRRGRRLRQHRLRAERLADIHRAVRRSGADDREEGDRRSQPRQHAIPARGAPRQGSHAAWTSRRRHAAEAQLPGRWRIPVQHPVPRSERSVSIREVSRTKPRWS